MAVDRNFRVGFQQPTTPVVDRSVSVAQGPPGPPGPPGGDGPPGPPGPVGPDTVAAVLAHINSDTPHPAYDAIPNLTLIIENNLL